MYRNIRRLSINPRKSGHNVVWTVPKPVSTKETTVQKSEQSTNIFREAKKSMHSPAKKPLYTLKPKEFGKSEVVQLGQCELNPEIWMSPVDQDVIYSALEWQNKYKTVDMSFEQSRLEVGQKRYSRPWQGSGHGFERVRDKTGGAFKGGAFTDEPRRPFISNFYVLDRETRLKALLSCLTVKNIQDDLIIVSSLEKEVDKLPVISNALNIKNEQKLSYLVLYDQSAWQLGVEKIERWAENQKYFNLFPLEGLNVKSLLKYDKLILDLDALNILENKLLFEIKRYDFLESHSEPEHPMLNRFWSDVMGKWKDEKFNLGGYKSGHHKFYRDWPDKSVSD